MSFFINVFLLLLKWVEKLNTTRTDSNKEKGGGKQYKMTITVPK